MQPAPVSLLHPLPRNRMRTAVVASADRSFRQRLAEILTGLRWQVREAESGAEAWGEVEAVAPEAIIVDSWLPDLDLAEFLSDFRDRFPQVDMVSASGSTEQESPRGPYRQELLHALRCSQDTDTAAWNTAPVMSKASLTETPAQSSPWPVPAFSTAQPIARPLDILAVPMHSPTAATRPSSVDPRYDQTRQADHRAVERLPELIGNAPCMLEVSRRVRLVAPRMTPVLIEGPTGSGKELVAEALHRLSARNRKPFVAINCAAIPEALLEAELFGHTRGAFTGAVQGRVGRIESADGGTLFLDEIGEMPLALQSKLLRFVESSELQRVATTPVRLPHQPPDGRLRADLQAGMAAISP